MKKKPILKCILGCLIVMLPFFVVWGYIFLFPQNYMDSQWTYSRWNRDICVSDDVNAKVVIIGDSVPNSCMIPAELSDDTYNLSMGGTSILEGYEALKEYFDHHETKPEVVYISYYDDHMAADTSFREITMYYHRFSLPIEYDLIKTFSRTQNNSMSRVNAATELFQYHFAFPSLYMTSLTDGYIAGMTGENREKYNEIDATRGCYCITDEVLTDPVEYPHSSYSVDPVIDERLRQTIDMCRASGVRVRIVLPPEAPTISYNPSYLEEINDYYGRLINDYPDITIDVHPDLGLALSDYSDHVHFNRVGAHKVTAYIREKYAEDFE